MLANMDEIARRLRHFRAKENTSQEDIAKVAGMAQNAWAGWEKKPPKALQSIVDLARHYQVSADFLLGLTDNPKPSHVHLDDAATELLLALRKLPLRRQRDVLVIVRAYLEQHANTPHDEARLAREMFELIKEYGGQNRLDDLLAWLLRQHDLGFFDDDDKEPPEDDS